MAALNESPRLTLLETLDMAFPRRPPAEFLMQLDDVDNTIVELCEASLVALLGRTNRDLQHVMGNAIIIDGRLYNLKVRPDVERDRTLHVILQDSTNRALSSSSAYVRSEVTLGQSIGKYDKLLIAMPLGIGAKRCENACALVVDLFTAGYYWLEERVKRSLELMETGFEQDTLQLVRRQLFAHDRVELSRQVWLVMVENGRVQYAIDPGVTAQVLDSASNHSERLQQGPATIASALLANSIPLAKSFSREAIETRQTIDMQLEDTPYNDVGEDFRLAQGAIYQKAMSLTPLAGDRKRWLLAAYPTSIRPEVTDALTAASEDLEDYLASTKKKMRPAVDRLRRSADAGTLGDFTGRLIWGVIEGASGI